MTNWLAEYAETEDINEQYKLLRAEMSRLRGRRDAIEFFDDAAVTRDLRRLTEGVEGELVVFLANDFGRPRVFRPESLPRSVQNEVRQAVLETKYDDTNEGLRAIRDELLACHPAIHKGLVVEYGDSKLSYYLPEGSTELTNFLTVREVVGLIDYTTNSTQRDGLSVTY